MRFLLITLLSLAAFTVASAADPTTAPAAHAADISLADLKAAIAGKKAILLDANGTDSFKTGHIPGAIDFAGTADLAKALPADKGTLIIAYCGSPQCPAWKSAAAKATELGYTQVKHFAGGLKGWQDAGEKLEAAKQN